MADHLIVDIELARLRARTERTRVAEIQQGEQRVAEQAQDRPSLGNLLRLATRQRERIERLTERAQQADLSGEGLERDALAIHDEHDLLIDHINKQYDELKAYNSEMRAQLGNDVPTRRASGDAQGDSSTSSAEQNVKA